MPCVTIKNETQVPLHIALRHVSPVHFVNNVPPGGQAVFKRVGRVWFTIEARLARGAVSSDGQRASAANQSLSSQTGSSQHGRQSSSSDLSDEAPKQREMIKRQGGEKSPSFRKRMQMAKENNEYTLVQTFAAPVAISVAALSLGAGAAYIGVAATAAGGLSAALSSIGAQVGVTVASQAPTVQQLYKYVRKGYKVVQIGQVVGIGGKAVKDANKGSNNKDVAGQKEAKNQAAKSEENDTLKELSPKEAARAVELVKESLSYLVNDSVVKSHGWFMKRDRTFSITGGPRAAELEQWLIIDTDTIEPFCIASIDAAVDDDDQPDPTAEQEAIQAEQIATTS